MPDRCPGSRAAPTSPIVAVFLPPAVSPHESQAILPGSAMTAILGTRALNRALLARQHLLERVALAPLAALHHLVGLQAQAPDPPYYGLWSRIDGFQPHDLGALVEDGRAVRLALMRSTIHLVAADDAAILRPIFQPVLEAALRASYGKALEGVSRRQLVEEARTLMAAHSRSSSELGRGLARRWRGRSPQALAYAARAWIPLVQVPPRGVWGRSGKAGHLPLDVWPGASIDGDGAPDEAVIRYLRAFGPATAADIRQWSGLTGLSEVLGRLRPRLRRFRDERGRELFDVPDGVLPDPDTPARARLVAPFDNLVLAHADRSRIMDERARESMASLNGMVPGTVLLDGFVAGSWKVTRVGKTRSMHVEPYRRWSRTEKRDVRDEAERLLAFASGGVGRGELMLDGTPRTPEA